MPIDPTNTLAKPQPISTREAQQEQQSIGRDAFMKLLVTQMQNQDPLDPMDNREMVTQLSQLTGVEQLVGIQQRLSALEIASAGIANTQVAGIVGKQVTANLDSLPLSASGPVDGHFEVEGRASEVTITIRNQQTGEVIRTIELGERFPGQHSFTWDGNDMGGTRMPEGRYSIEVTARDEAGNPVETSTEISGRATGVSYGNGYPELVVGDARVMLGDVTSISE